MSTSKSKQLTRPERADMGWLLRFILRHRNAALGAVVSGIVGGSAAAAEPYLIGRIIDHVGEGTTTGQLLRDVMVLVGLTLISVVAFFGQRRFSGTVAYTVSFDIREVLFNNMVKLDQSFYQRYATGDLISRMYSDLTMIWRLLALTFNRVGSALFTVVVAMILLGAISIPLTVTVFVILSISTAVQLRAGRFLTRIFEKVQDQAGVLSALVQDSVSGIQTIKTTGREAGVAGKFLQENKEFRRRWLFFRRRNEPVGMLPNMISELTAGIVVLFGGVLAVNGELSLGDFAQFLIYLQLISTALLQLGTIYQRYLQTAGALTRLTPLLQPANIRTMPDARRLPTPHGEIRFDHVSVKIGDEWLLRDIDLHIPAGQTIALVGPTGCGKTTLVNLLARVFDPTEGHILIDDIDVRDLELDDVRRAVAYVPQSTFLFSQRLRDNVDMGMDGVSDGDVDRAVKIARVSNDLAQLPQGLETVVGEKGVMLSGGQRQRVAIARAVVRDPAILVLDDALSSVDTQTAAQILGDLRQVMRSRTSIIIAHRIATVKDADCIYVLENGRIVESGTHHDLIERGGHYAQMADREMDIEEARSHGGG